jgi:hypothetical protein
MLFGKPWGKTPVAVKAATDSFNRSLPLRGLFLFWRLRAVVKMTLLQGAVFQSLPNKHETDSPPLADTLVICVRRLWSSGERYRLRRR